MHWDDDNDDDDDDWDEDNILKPLKDTLKFFIYPFVQNNCFTPLRTSFILQR